MQMVTLRRREKPTIPMALSVGFAVRFARRAGCLSIRLFSLDFDQRTIPQATLPRDDDPIDLTEREFHWVKQLNIRVSRNKYICPIHLGHALDACGQIGRVTDYIRIQAFVASNRSEEQTSLRGPILRHC